jgi:large subunit ribosomal protein L3
MATTQSQSSAIKGILGKKLGMTQVFDANNKIVPVTVIAAGPCIVTQIRTHETDGYTAVQLAFGAIDPRKVSKPQTGHFAKAGVTPRADIAELRISNVDSYSVGQELHADTFAAGEIIDATGTSRGKGTAGVMKRHGFAGLGASHGVDRKHRGSGSIGNRTTPGRVFKGKRMMGHMGGETVTTQNLLIHSVDVERNLILVRGAVPGATNSTVFLRTAAKKVASETLTHKAGA